MDRVNDNDWRGTVWSVFAHFFLSLPTLNIFKPVLSQKKLP